MRKRNELGMLQAGPRLYDWLLEFESVRSWVNPLRPATRAQYLYFFNEFLKFAKIENPDDLLNWDEKRAADSLLKFSQNYMVQGKQKSAQMCVVAVKAFFRMNDRELRTAKLRIKRVPLTDKSYTRIVPTKDQVFMMSDVAGSLRNRALILFLYQSGLRNSTVRNLNISHLREGLLHGEVPLRLLITPSIDKASLGEGYYTFINREAVEALQAYLNSRGGLDGLPDNAALFAREERFGKDQKLTAGAILRIVKTAAKNASLDPKRIWAHCLRAAFYNQLIGVGIEEPIREFLMGHTLGVRNHYFVPAFIEKGKKEYLKVNWSRERIIEVTDEAKIEQALEKRWQEQRDELYTEAITELEQRLEQRIRDLSDKVTPMLEKEGIKLPKEEGLAKLRLLEVGIEEAKKRRKSS